MEIAAMSAARRRSWAFAGIGAVAAVLMLLLSGEFVTLHCVILAAITLAAGLSCAWAASTYLPAAGRRAGMLGGMTAALAYVLPFIVVFVHRLITIDAATASRMAGELSAAQATSLIQQSIVPGVDYFRGQYISYVAGYLLFGLLFGMLLGALGGLLARRTHTHSQ
ncbi:MAG: hypothetical protein M1546_16725 [Chloroflexi bacterium]|nr:hypothetical protein [Chloroflexota bacterium]